MNKMNLVAMNTTSELFVKKDVPITINADYLKQLLGAIYKVVCKLQDLDSYLIPEVEALTRQTDLVLDKDEYMFRAVDKIDEFLKIPLDDVVFNMENVMVSTKPSANYRLHCFIENWKLLLELCREVSNLYLLEEATRKKIRFYVSSCIYNAVCFIIVQYNAECEVFKWTPRTETDYQVSALAMDFCEANNMSLDSFYDWAYTVFTEYRPQFTNNLMNYVIEQELFNKLRYTFLDLYDVEYLLNEATLDALLQGTLLIEDFEELVYQELNKKFNLQ